MTQTFDLNEYRRRRVRDLEQRCEFLEGERDRLERILATLLLMAARTVNRDPMLILDACLTLENIEPSYAAIHEPPLIPPATRRKNDAAA